MEVFASGRRRFGAYCIDIGITALVQLPLWIWYARGLFGPEIGLFLLGYTVLLPIIWVLVRAIYLIICWSVWNQTIGMRLFSIIIVPSPGKRLTVWRSMIRYLSMVLCTYTLGIGYLMMFSHPSRQGLHDRLSSTIVVHTGSRST